MAEKEVLLKVDNITKRFGGIVAVDHVSCTVRKGEVVSIIGPNGAGKTTVFNMLTGVYEVDEGEIIFNGNPIHNKDPKEIVAAGISRTFQNIRLFSDLRVIENVLIGAHIKTKYNFFQSVFRTKKFREEEDRKTAEAIQLLKSIGLDYRRDDYASNLPYGEQRKLEITRAIATGAQLLLLDEPSLGLAPNFVLMIFDMIREINKQGVTILLIEQNANMALSASDRAYVLENGKVTMSGEAKKIASDPKIKKAYLGLG